MRRMKRPLNCENNLNKITEPQLTLMTNSGVYLSGCHINKYNGYAKTEFYVTHLPRKFQVIPMAIILIQQRIVQVLLTMFQKRKVEFTGLRHKMVRKRLVR